MHNSTFFLLNTAAENDWSYQLLSEDRQLLLQSGGYKTKGACIAKIAAVTIHACHENRFEKINKDERYSFRLKCGQGEVVGKSILFSNEADCDKAIDIVKEQAVWAVIENG